MYAYCYLSLLPEVYYLFVRVLSAFTLWLLLYYKRLHCPNYLCDGTQWNSQQLGQTQVSFYSSSVAAFRWSLHWQSYNVYLAHTHTHVVLLYSAYCVDSHVDSTIDSRVVWQAFLSVFIMEAVLKIFAMPIDYWKSSWNIFDMIVIAASIVDVGVSQIHGLSVIRTFRLVGQQLI